MKPATGAQLETRACRLLPQLRNSAKRLRHLEDENRRLKIAVADLTLDREVLKAVISKTGGAREPARGRRVRAGKVSG